jgi:HPt (histidine-containing phosphotransfer) domain-containing protein
VREVAKPELERELEALRREFGQQLPARLAALQTLLRALKASGDTAGLEEAQQLAHKLRGSAGSYGFHELSDEMKRVEGALDVLLRGTSSAAWEELERAIRRALERVGEAGSPDGTADAGASRAGGPRTR